MVANEQLLKLFCKRVNELALEHDLTDAESQRIMAVFRQAMANSFMDESQIYIKLTQEVFV